MSMQPIVRTLALLVAAPVIAAQFQSSASKAPPQIPQKECVELVVLLDSGISVTSVSKQALTEVMASDTAANMHLLSSIEEIPSSQAADFVAHVGMVPGVLVAELLQPAGVPEIDACGEPTGTSAQQCTISFADGTPSDDEFHAQDVLAKLDFETAKGWFKNQHQPVRVAVIDTGIDPTHPALLGHVTGTGWDFVADKPGGFDHANGLDDDKDGWIDEAYGHGTFLSSVILLIDPDAWILPLRVLDADGNGNSFDVADALYYAADHGAQVINLSLSMNEPSTAVAAAMEYARYKGATIYVAAGNTSAEKVLFPANYDASTFQCHVPFLPKDWQASDSTVKAVASTDAEGIKADFSAWGPEVDLVTPGVGVYGAMPGGGYAWWSGTSMSTAVASGVGALVKSVAGIDFAVLHHGQENVLLLTAQPVDKDNQVYAGGLGDGMVNAWYASYLANKAAEN